MAGCVWLIIWLLGFDEHRSVSCNVHDGVIVKLQTHSSSEFCSHVVQNFFAGHSEHQLVIVTQLQSCEICKDVKTVKL